MTSLLFEPRTCVKWGHTENDRVPPNASSWKEPALPLDRTPSEYVSIYGLSGPDGRIRYVGRTGKTLEHRVMRHKWQARSHGATCSKRVSVWIREQRFDIKAELLDTVPRDEASRREWEWMQRLKSEGFDLVNRLGNDWSPSPEQRAVIVATNRKRFQDPVARERIARISRERVFSEEERMAMSARATGRKHTPEAKAKMSAARKGVPKSDETRERMRQAQARRRAEGQYQSPSPETRQKISDALRGRPKSETHKRRISEGHRRRRQGGGL